MIYLIFACWRVSSYYHLSNLNIIGDIRAPDVMNRVKHAMISRRSAVDYNRQQAVIQRNCVIPMITSAIICFRIDYCPGPTSGRAPEANPLVKPDTLTGMLEALMVMMVPISACIANLGEIEYGRFSIL